MKQSAITPFYSIIALVVGFLIPLVSTNRLANAAPKPQSTIDSAMQAVVRIVPQRCGPAGCRKLGVGSGAIIHPSGVILTAWHVAVENPNNLLAPGYADDFVVEMTSDVRRQPEPRYRAELIAVKPEMDLALLRIYQEIGTNRSVAQDSANALPTLPISTAIPNTGQLHILGYPDAGGGSIKYPEFGISGFADNGTLITIQGTLSQGFSGGPALFAQDGRLAIAGVVIRRRGDLGEVGLLRSIDQLNAMTWKPGAQRVWAENIQIAVQGSGVDATLRISANIQALDYVDHQGRLLAYIFDSTTQEPLLVGEHDLPHDTHEHVALRQDFSGVFFVELDQQIAISLPVNQLNIAPDQLRFRLLLWDVDGTHVLWTDNQWLQAQLTGNQVALVPRNTSIPTATPTSTPNPTATNTPFPTTTPTFTATPVPSTVTNTPTLSYTPKPKLTSLPTFTATFTSTPTKLPMATSTHTKTPLPPTSSVKLTATMNTDPSVYDNFNNLTYDGSFDPTLWASTPKNGFVVYQQNGVIVFSNGTSNRSDDFVLEVRRSKTRTLKGLQFFEGQLLLDSDHGDGYSFVKIQVVSAALINEHSWWTQCRLGATGFTSYYVCDVYTVDSNSKFVREYETDSISVKFNTWYTSRIEIDPNSVTLKFYLNDRLAGSYTPKDSQSLMTATFNSRIGIWSDGVKTTGYLDNIRISP